MSEQEQGVNATYDDGVAKLPSDKPLIGTFLLPNCSTVEGVGRIEYLASEPFVRVVTEDEPRQILIALPALVFVPHRYGL